MSKYSNMKGNSLLAVLSKNFENVPKAIPKSSIANVSIICLLTDIVFSLHRIVFKNDFITLSSPTFDLWGW